MATPKKTIRSQFRVHQQGLDLIHEAANILDLSISEFIRCNMIEKSMNVISDFKSTTGDKKKKRLW